MKRHSYEIRIEERLGESWTDWFEGLAIRHEADESGAFTRTVLYGTMDQAKLHGILARVRDLGLTLLSITRVIPLNKDQSNPKSGGGNKNE